jgi:3-oxosteroid 1-dehydrogenase
MEVDVIVVGSGAGALLTAVRAADAGLSVQVVEKTALFGGTSAISGGGIWIPCNHDQSRHGIRDSVEEAFRYVRTAARGLATDDRVLAYVETAHQMARYLNDIGVRYRAMPLYADYYPHLPGALPGGRTMDPVAFDARRLGLQALSLVRPTNPGQLILGRMGIDAFDARTLIAKEPGANWALARIMARYFLDYPWRLKTRRDRRMTGGQALIGGLYAALRRRKVGVWLSSPLKELVMDGPRVSGVVVEREGAPVRLTARRGVVLAAGGFERNQTLREQHR